MNEVLFSKLHEDVILSIFVKLDDDPRHWARLACVCTKFSSLIRNICWKNKCESTIPSLVNDLISSSDSGVPNGGGWASLNKLAVCCPGLLHAGVLLENSDFGLERELGPDESYRKIEPVREDQCEKNVTEAVSCSYSEAIVPSSECAWSLFDDLYYDTVYNTSEVQDEQTPIVDEMEQDDLNLGQESSIFKKRKVCRSMKAHIAPSVCNLSREQGNKLLASRFRGDCLYICDWPGCVHIEEKRDYMLFRGIFKNFKRSRVWRTINDGNRNKIDLNCAFCSCTETYDLYSSFCLRRGFGYHDDGEPVVRAYVCENGHVSGAWTDWPLYT